MKVKLFKQKKWLIGLGVIALLAISIGVWFGVGMKNHDHNQTKLSSKVNLGKNSGFHCPMHPHITSDKPGQKCSICGMDLVPIEADDDEEIDNSDHAEGSTMENESDDDHGSTTEQGGKNDDAWDDLSDAGTVAVKDKNKGEKLTQHAPVKLTLKKQQMIGVKLYTVKKQKLFKSIRAPGRIAFDPELYTAQSEYVEALKQWNRVKLSPLEEVKRNTREMIRSSKIRLKILGLSEEQIKDIGKNRTQNENLLLSEKGETNWVYADVFEMDLPYIEKDLAVQVSASYLQGKTLPGKVVSVDRVINPQTRTAKIRIKLLKESHLIRPESYVNVEIIAPLGEHLSIPTEAVMHTGRETIVFVKKSNKGKFEPRRVRISLENDNFMAVSDLKEGEEVVVGGNFMVDSESRLKAVIQSATSSQAEHQH